MKTDWINHYWNFMAAADFESAMTLKSFNFPPSFFKYRNLSLLSLENIRDNYIWLADIASLNDPFECSLQFDNDACLRIIFASHEFQLRFSKLTGQILNNEEINSLLDSPKPFERYIALCNKKGVPFNLTQGDQLKKVQVRGAEIVEDGNQNLTICSFSVVNDLLLLWSHYSGEHKGICIEYDFSDVDVIRAFIQPVNYRNSVHKINSFENYTSMQVIAASLIKSKDWSYEQEWRVTMFKQDKNYIQRLPVPAPKGIYLGTRFHLNDEALKKSLFTLASEKEIPLFQMSKHPGEFKLVKGKEVN